jgi:hypothetical protein
MTVVFTIEKNERKVESSMVYIRSAPLVKLWDGVILRLRS